MTQLFTELTILQENVAELCGTPSAVSKHVHHPDRVLRADRYDDLFEAFVQGKDG